MAARKQVPILDMGAAFVSAVLADNERLRKELDERQSAEQTYRNNVACKEDDYRRMIGAMAARMGGDVEIESNRGYVDDRRLLIDSNEFGRSFRVRLLADDALAVLDREVV